MKALSVRQPWAQLVAIGAKRIETRSWPTRHRGRLAIHAARRFPNDCILLMEEEPFRHHLAAAGYCTDSRDNPRRRHQLLTAGEGAILPMGAIVAVADLVGCDPIARRKIDGATLLLGDEETRQVQGDELAFGDYTPGRFGWVLSSVRPLPEPIPCRGMLGLWEVPADVIHDIYLAGGIP